MHKIMLALSTECRERGDPPEARRAIGRAQCNDAYWHGVFGGLYLPFLRGHVWHQLANGEALLRAGESLTVETRDVDADGHDEVWIRSDTFSVLIAPVRGGSIEMWLDLTRRQNLLDVLARHREAYHEPLGSPPPSAEQDSSVADTGPPSIHELDAALTGTPPIDVEPRGLFVDRILPANGSRDDLIDGRMAVVRTWAGQPMDAEWHLADGDVALHLRCDDLAKTLYIGRAGVRCEWRWQPGRFAADAWFSTELSFSSPLSIDASGAEQWEYPIETVAKSEKGFDRLTQGTAVVLRWPASAGEARVTVRVDQEG
jgi:alpha-amylase